MSTPVWIVAAMIAVLWPARFIGPLDGVPLDRVLEAALLGVTLPWLFWIGRDGLTTRTFRAAVIALLLWKAGTALVASQQGLCATFRSPQPLDGTAQTVRIAEPKGWLRSWDLRADIWSADPECTAILTRALPTMRDFPAWFINITGMMQPDVPIEMQAHGFVTTRDGVSHPMSYSTTLLREPWSFDPQFDGTSIFRALVTSREPSPIDRFLAPWAWLVSPALCLLIAGSLLFASLAPLAIERGMWIWMAAGSAAAVACGLSSSATVQRAAGALAFGALLVRWPERSNALRIAALTIGLPWLALFVTLSVASVGRLSAYSAGDDWLTYQVAGYRIFMNGRWLEAGTDTFDYQALYRWITGLLHLVFGDSSVGEMYWDASLLLIGALLAFHIAKEVAGTRWGVVAAALSLVTFTVATPWFIIGRGLSEITSAGLGFLAIAFLLHSGRRASWVAAAGVMAGLMFYARQNQLLWAPALAVMLVPLSVGSDLASVRAAVTRIPWSRVTLYLGIFGAAILAFMVRTWYFTGRFALFFGTSLGVNDTNLRPWTVFDATVWSKVGHSLMGFVFMNEPPHIDPRAAVLVAGAIVAVLALLQTPLSRRIPAALLVVTVSGVASAFLAHSHGYPGRFTIHMVPLAAALSVIAISPASR